MIKKLFATLSFALIITSAHAQENSVVLSAMKKEMQRTMSELKSQAVPPYFLS